MDKSLGNLYHKLSNLFHSNSSSTTSSSTTDIDPTNNPTDRSTTMNPVPLEQRRSSGRMSRQISIKTNDNRITTPTNNETFFKQMYYFDTFL